MAAANTGIDREFEEKYGIAESSRNAQYRIFVKGNPSGLSNTEHKPTVSDALFPLRIARMGEGRNRVLSPQGVRVFPK